MAIVKKQRADHWLEKTVIAANIKQTADALKVSPECAVYLMSVVSLMRLGRYKTRLDYAQAIKDIEKQFKVDVRVGGGRPQWRRFCVGSSVRRFKRPVAGRQVKPGARQSPRSRFVV